MQIEYFSVMLLFKKKIQALFPPLTKKQLSFIGFVGKLLVYSSGVIDLFKHVRSTLLDPAERVC